MSMSDQFWGRVTADVDAERDNTLLTQARVAAASTWSFLAQAETTEEFDDRLALADDRLHKSVEAVVGNDVAAHAEVYPRLLASFQQDFEVLKQGARKQSSWADRAWGWPEVYPGVKAAMDALPEGASAEQAAQAVVDGLNASGGYRDSHDREISMEWASEKTGVPYNDIYDAWDALYAQGLVASRKQASAEPDFITMCRRIVERKAYEEWGPNDVVVDMNTANVVVKVYDAIGAANKAETAEKVGFERFVDFAWSRVASKKTASDTCPDCGQFGCSPNCPGPANGGDCPVCGHPDMRLSADGSVECRECGHGRETGGYDGGERWATRKQAMFKARAVVYTVHGEKKYVISANPSFGMAGPRLTSSKEEATIFPSLTFAEMAAESAGRLFFGGRPGPMGGAGGDGTWNAYGEQDYGLSYRDATQRHAMDLVDPNHYEYTYDDIPNCPACGGGDSVWDGGACEACGYDSDDNDVAYTPDWDDPTDADVAAHFGSRRAAKDPNARTMPQDLKVGDVFDDAGTKLTVKVVCPWGACTHGENRPESVHVVQLVNSSAHFFVALPGNYPLEEWGHFYLGSSIPRSGYATKATRPFAADAAGSREGARGVTAGHARDHGSRGVPSSDITPDGLIDTVMAFDNEARDVFGIDRGLGPGDAEKVAAHIKQRLTETFPDGLASVTVWAVMDEMTNLNYHTALAALLEWAESGRTAKVAGFGDTWETSGSNSQALRHGPLIADVSDDGWANIYEADEPMMQPMMSEHFETVDVAKAWAAETMADLAGPGHQTSLARKHAAPEDGVYDTKCPMCGWDHVELHDGDFTCLSCDHNWSRYDKVNEVMYDPGERHPGYIEGSRKQAALAGDLKPGDIISFDHIGRHTESAVVESVEHHGAEVHVNLVGTGYMPRMWVDQHVDVIGFTDEDPAYRMA